MVLFRMRRLAANLRGASAATTRADLGKAGEQAAATFLRKSQGFKIIRRNWRSGQDEIDLICRDGEAVVFVEVRLREADSMVDGYASIDARKRKALLRVCTAFLDGLKAPPSTFRLDVVAVAHRDGAILGVRHFAGVHLFPKHYRPRQAR